MNVKVVKGPMFEKKEIDVYRFIQKVIKKQVEQEKKKAV